MTIVAGGVQWPMPRSHIRCGATAGSPSIIQLSRLGWRPRAWPMERLDHLLQLRPSLASPSRREGCKRDDQDEPTSRVETVARERACRWRSGGNASHRIVCFPDLRRRPRCGRTFFQQCGCPVRAASAAYRTGPAG
jgi:hypothetical protein